MSNSFIEDVLSVVDDSRRLGQRRDNDSPLADLITAYNALAAADEDIEVMTDDDTGRDLKNAIGLLPIADQIALLNQFSVNLKKSRTPYGYESVKDRDNNLFRHRVLTIMVVGIVLIIASVVGSLIAIAFFSGEISGPVIRPYIVGVLEIFKVIFGIKGQVQ